MKRIKYVANLSLGILLMLFLADSVAPLLNDIVNDYNSKSGAAHSETYIPKPSLGEEYPHF